jgi:hypothetical protein
MGILRYPLVTSRFFSLVVSGQKLCLLYLLYLISFPPPLLSPPSLLRHRWAWTLKNWKKSNRMPGWVTVVWAAWPPVFWTVWPPSASPATATASAMSSAFSSSIFLTGSRCRPHALVAVLRTKKSPASCLF